MNCSDSGIHSSSMAVITGSLSGIPTASMSAPHAKGFSSGTPCAFAMANVKASTFAFDGSHFSFIVKYVLSRSLLLLALPCKPNASAAGMFFIAPETSCHCNIPNNFPATIAAAKRFCVLICPTNAPTLCASSSVPLARQSSASAYSGATHLGVAGDLASVICAVGSEQALANNKSGSSTTEKSPCAIALVRSCASSALYASAALRKNVDAFGAKHIHLCLEQLFKLTYAVLRSKRCLKQFCWMNA